MYKFNLDHLSPKKPKRDAVAVGEKTLNPSSLSMAKSSSTVDKIKDLYRSQIANEANWAVNSKLLCAVGLFAGSVFIMRNFGDLMAV